ncbi:type IV-A pilus assembly ATPase PilB [Halomonas piscis]|uniref:Type IV-A pilus assembly ATPase PilB n=1 Tax=Halomonas piscis TaxID=3031727 RepID=A0ABY9YW31_9GAMM|nr:type IV-A pilus assembly ATPase PilB [Halomonas piscis]WNK18982.1 type IV-A pilus assembly ATPase PilB [Halomonas piscis]
MSQPPYESMLSHAAARGGRRGIAERLVRQGLLSDTGLAAAEAAAAREDTELLRYVVEEGLVAPAPAAVAAGREYGLPVLDLDAVNPEALPPAREYPARILRELQVLPLARRGRLLTVAIPYPATLTQLDELQFATGLRVEGVLAPVDQLAGTLQRYIAQNERSMLESLGQIDDAISSLETEDDEYHPELDDDTDDAPIIKFVNKILLDAANSDASDIHFEPYEHLFRVRFRVDGILAEVAQPPFSLRDRIAARLKVMARLDVSERRLPQDGNIRLRLSRTRSLDFRVNSLPTVYGEKLVLRLLDPAAAQMGIDELGFSEVQRRQYEKALDKPQGMVLVTGPTGSGKTVTLYTGLNILNQVERNICTAEDPVEIRLPGVNQVNVKPRIGLDFASALRAFLRQDPDVVMVGEVRDLETAENAVKASQTGHLVLSTLHTNSAAETLVRLSNIGVTAFNIASSVNLIIAQRLVRKLCPACKMPAEIPPEALAAMGLAEADTAGATLYRAAGCKKCTQGYKGRTGVYEVLPVSETMRGLIMRNASAMEIDALAREEGYVSLYHSGVQKVLAGITSLEELNRVTKE